jgi:glutamate/aspartate transport system ATP-binding protein
MAMMCLTHEMGFAKQVADRVIFMDEGQIVDDCGKDEFFSTVRSERSQQFLSKILNH